MKQLVEDSPMSLHTDGIWFNDDASSFSEHHSKPTITTIVILHNLLILSNNRNGSCVSDFYE